MAVFRTVRCYDSFTITHGLSISGAPLPHSIGVAVARTNIRGGFTLTEVFERLIEKGSVLPVKKTENFKTVRRLKKEENDNPLWIKVGEGESEIPDRNTFVCELGIKGSDLPHDLPQGTDIQLTIEINDSRELFVTVYIPLIDLALNARSTYKDELIDVKDAQAELEAQTERALTVSENCSSEEKSEIANTIGSVSTSLRNAQLDEDEKRKASKQLRDLKTMLDQLEKEKEMPQLVKEFNGNVESVKDILTQLADSKNKAKYEEQLTQMKAEGEKAVSANDKPLLIRVNEQLRGLVFRALFSDPATVAHYFHKLTDGSHKFTNEKEAAYYTEKGRRAIELGDVDELKRCYDQLTLLLPSEDQGTFNNSLSRSGITR